MSESHPCPRCNKSSKITKKEWVYHVYNVKQYYCEDCNRHFNLYYKNDQLKFMIPKPGSVKPPLRLSKKSNASDHSIKIFINELDIIQNYKYFKNEYEIELEDIYMKMISSFPYQFKCRELFYASFYLILRMKNEPILLSDISNISNISQKNVAKTYRKIVHLHKINVPPLNIKNLIKERTKRLGFTPEESINAIHFYEDIKSNIPTIGIAPRGLAAISVYGIYRQKYENFNKNKFLELFDISDATFKKNLKLMDSYFHARAPN